MGRTYSGILGLIAFATVVARGCIHGAAISSTIPWACGCLFAFAAVGLVVGWLAERTVQEGVIAQFVQRMRQDETQQRETLAE